jgi:hypothetical protein
MRAILVAVLALVCTGAQAGERQRFRVVGNNCPQFVVVSAPAPCTFCTDCKCAAGKCPSGCPVVAAPAAVAPVASCPGGVCPAPSYAPVRGGLFRRW